MNEQKIIRKLFFSLFQKIPEDIIDFRSVPLILSYIF